MKSNKLSKRLPIGSFERVMLRKRTKNGLDAARQQGRIGGHRPKLTPQQQEEIIAFIKSGKKTAVDAAQLFRVHPSTICRLVFSTGSMSSATYDFA